MKRGAGVVRATGGFDCMGDMVLVEGMFAVSNGSAPSVSISGAGTLLKEGDSSWTLSTAQNGLSGDFRKLCNPTGRFVIGGSFGDAGVTGRKIICDTYGGGGRHGGGAFSGKDPTKVDRTAAYRARFRAKHLLRKYALREAEVQLSYAIGMRDPISVAVMADRKWDTSMAEECLRDYDLTPAGIISFLGLRSVKFSSVSSYGHFTDQSMPWERI